MSDVGVLPSLVRMPRVRACALRQRQALKQAGCSVIRTEKVSGRSREGRIELETILEFLRPGDALVVTKLDGARSLCECTRWQSTKPSPRTRHSLERLASVKPK
jgi:hypothetical protein